MSRRRFTFVVLVLSGLGLALEGFLEDSLAQGPTTRLLAPSGVLTGTDEQELRWPVAVAAASEDEIAVAEAHEPRLLLYRRESAAWTLLRAVTLPGTPVDLVHDGQRYLASLRGVTGLVSFEGPDLLQRRISLPQGVVPGSLAIELSGDLLTYDFASGKVLRITQAGAKTKEVMAPGFVTDIASTPAGGFLAAIASEGSLLRFDANWEISGTWKMPSRRSVPSWPTGLLVEPGGDVLVVDRHTGRILVLDGEGSPEGFGAGQGWEPGLLLFPAGIERLPDGLIVVADQGNSRVQIFRRTDRTVDQ